MGTQKTLWHTFTNSFVPLEGALMHEAAEVKRLKFSPDKEYLIAACSARGAMVLCGKDGKFVSRLDGHSGCVFDVAWAKDAEEDVLLTASHDCECKLWRMGRDSRSADG